MRSYFMCNACMTHKPTLAISLATVTFQTGETAESFNLLQIHGVKSNLQLPVTVPLVHMKP